MIAVDDKSCCCGCEACRQRCPHGCITLHEDEQGFVYPTVNLEACVDCHLCEQVCPFLNDVCERESVLAVAAINPDVTVRMNSSSGGIFSVLSGEVIKRGGVVFGARFDERWNVIHDFTDTLEGLPRFRGSKYVQSVIGDSYVKAEEFLRQGREVLFSGTPCQIAGLRSFLRRSYDNLLLVEVACHGVPSPKVWREHLDSTSGNELPAIVNFRHKSTGWKDYSVVIGTTSRRHDDDDFMACFLGDYSLRPSCFNCRFKAGASGADLTLADFWGIQAIAPHLDDDKGTSLVVVNTAKGKDAMTRTGLDIVEVDYPKVVKANPALERAATCPQDYDAFWRQFNGGNPRRAIRRYARRHRPGLTIRLKRFCRRLLGK